MNATTQSSGLPQLLKEIGPVEVLFDTKQTAGRLNRASVAVCQEYISHVIHLAQPWSPQQNFPLLAGAFRVLCQLDSARFQEVSKAFLAFNHGDRRPLGRSLLPICVALCPESDAITFWDKLSADQKKQALIAPGDFNYWRSLSDPTQLSSHLAAGSALIQALVMAGSYNAVTRIAKDAIPIVSNACTGADKRQLPGQFHGLFLGLADLCFKGCKFDSEPVTALMRLTASLFAFYSPADREYYLSGLNPGSIPNKELFEREPSILYVVQSLTTRDTAAKLFDKVKIQLERVTDARVGNEILWREVQACLGSRVDCSLDSTLFELRRECSTLLSAANTLLDRRLYAEGALIAPSPLYGFINSHPRLREQFLVEANKLLGSSKDLLATLRANCQLTILMHEMFASFAAIYDSPLAVRWSVVSLLARAKCPEGIDLESWATLVCSSPMAIFAVPIARELDCWPKAPDSFNNLQRELANLVGLTSLECPVREEVHHIQVSFDYIAFVDNSNNRGLVIEGTQKARNAFGPAVNMGLFGPGWYAKHRYLAFGLTSSSYESLISRVAVVGRLADQIGIQVYKRKLEIGLPLGDATLQWLTTEFVSFLQTLRGKVSVEGAVTAFTNVTQEILNRRCDDWWLKDLGVVQSEQYPILAKFVGDKLQISVLLNSENYKPRLTTR